MRATGRGRWHSDLQAASPPSPRLHALREEVEAAHVGADRVRRRPLGDDVDAAEAALAEHREERLLAEEPPAAVVAAGDEARHELVAARVDVRLQLEREVAVRREYRCRALEREERIAHVVERAQMEDEVVWPAVAEALRVLRPELDAVEAAQLGEEPPDLEVPRVQLEPEHLHPVPLAEQQRVVADVRADVERTPAAQRLLGEPPAEDVPLRERVLDEGLGARQLARADAVREDELVPPRRPGLEPRPELVRRQLGRYEQVVRVEPAWPATPRGHGAARLSSHRTIARRRPWQRLRRDRPEPRRVGELERAHARQQCLAAVRAVGVVEADGA